MLVFTPLVCPLTAYWSTSPRGNLIILSIRIIVATTAVSIIATNGSLREILCLSLEFYFF